jgi:hypothetical protein
MKLATTTSLTTYVPVLPRPSADAMYRFAGLGVAAGVPALFWTGVAWGTAQAFGLPLGAPTFAAVAAIVGGVCLLGASLAMSNRA